jgi:hypothetical protein
MSEPLVPWQAEGTLADVQPDRQPWGARRSPRNASGRGALIGATWLIGLGVVFLLQQSMDWSWGQAWPLFVILIGVSSAVSTLVGRARGLGAVWALTWPVVFIATGAVLLASTTGGLAVGPGELIDQAWPWVLVALGIWFLVGAFVSGGSSMEALTVPLADVQQANVGIKFGAGELVTRKAAPGNLVDGTFKGGVMHELGGPGRVELRQDLDNGWPWLDGESRWDVGLTGEVPLTLRLDVGAYRGTIDLSDLRVTTLELHTGASETHVRLPRAAGSTSVRAGAGAAALTLEVPVGVAGRIRARMALGSVDVDLARFPRIGDIYQSVDYATAANRVDIDVEGGVGSLRVVSGT